MANRLKKKTAKPPGADKLNPDREEDVTVQEVVKDERTAKIAGAASILFALFLFIAFTSYFSFPTVSTCGCFTFGRMIENRLPCPTLLDTSIFPA